MTYDPIVIERTFDAKAEQIWKAITDKNEMKQWYFDISEFKPEPGFVFTFHAGDEKKQYLHICTVMEVIPDKKISYTWAYENIPVETLVTFELEAEDDKTTLKLTHVGVENFPVENNEFAKENFIEGWTHIIGTALKDYLEKIKSTTFIKTK